MKNRGWTLALIISSVLLFVGFGAWGGFSVHSLRAIFFGQNIGLRVGTESAQPLGVEGEGLKSYVTENVRLLNISRKKLAKSFSKKQSTLKLIVGPWPMSCHPWSDRHHCYMHSAC